MYTERKKKALQSQWLTLLLVLCIMRGFIGDCYRLEQIAKDGQKKGGIAPAFIVLIFIYFILSNPP